MDKPPKIVMDKQRAKELIETDEDFVFSQKYNFSLKQMLNKNPSGLDDEAIAKALMMTVEEVEEEFLMAVAKIKKALGV
jgi:hypothetical protein